MARYLAAALDVRRHRTALAVGSLGPPGSSGHAETFFGGRSLAVFPFDEAVASWRAGSDPMAARMPMHPSFETKPVVPDRCFGEVAPSLAGHATAAWGRVFTSSAAFMASEVLHLHHLGPLHAAAGQVLPGRPVVTHLHGTELKFIDRVRTDSASAGPHGTWWAGRMTDLARDAAATICISPHDRDQAVRLLGLTPESIEVVPNGVDVRLFSASAIDGGERLEIWLRWLVEEPLAWTEQDHEPGALRAASEHVRAAFVDDAGVPRPVLLFVGRFLAFKRVGLLIRAYARARSERGIVAPLVVWGGSPGEWEGEHPVTAARECGLLGEQPSVFFVGWRGHGELPRGLACSDVLVAPSTDEPFGQVLLEAMSVGLPVISTQSGGPPSFVNVVPREEDGWLVPPDDERALAAAIATAALDAEERRRRGSNAARHVRAAWSWDAIAARVEALYGRVLDVG